MNIQLNQKALDQLSEIKNQCDSDNPKGPEFAGDRINEILRNLLIEAGYGEVVELAKATSQAAVDAISRAEERSLPK